MKKYLTKVNVVIISLLIVVAVFVSLSFVTMQTMTTSNTLTDSQLVEIKSGSTIRGLVSQLEQLDLVKCPKLLVLWTRLNGDAKRLQVGEYVIRPGTTLSDLMKDITSGRVHQYSLKLLEGWTFKEFMNAIQSH